MSQLYERIANLSPTQRELLVRRLENGRQVAATHIITRREANGRPPLSFAQQRLWLLDQLESGNPAYNIPTAVRLTGPLNCFALEQTLNEITRRHEALRTSFAILDDSPVQIIAPPLAEPLPFVDLSDLPEAAREAETLELASAEALLAFDLAQGPLLRATLLRLCEDDHVVLLTMHHIVSDGWSLGVFVAEMSALYDAFCDGQPSPLADLPIQYADFACWQRQWLQGEVLEAHLTYWRRQLESVPLLELLTDKPRPPIHTYHGAQQSFRFPPDLSESLSELSRQEDVTLFMLLLAAVQTLLYRYTGQTDISVGTPTAGRNRTEIEGLIGFFANTLVLRTDLSGNPTFRELLGRVRGGLQASYAHQDLPFEKLVEVLQLERDLSHTPLFQVMFIWQNAPMPDLKLRGLTLVPLAVHNGTAKYDLTLNLALEGESIGGTMQYNSDLFERDTIMRMLGHLEMLLKGVATFPGQRLLELPLLTALERQELLVDSNNTHADYPQDKCIHHLIQATAERTPDAVAVSFEQQQLTYSELNRRANQLAHHLRTLGVGPEVLVGICLERSLEMMIALLGVLKAGGGYVPLDPSYPKERIAFMLEDSRVVVLLTQQRLDKGLPEHNARAICLDTDWKAISAESEENPNGDVTGANLAYVIYTSGSTGKPKGVQIPHGAVVNFLNSMRREPGLTETDVFVAVTTLSFDIAGLELFLPLVAGASVVLVGSEVLSSPGSLNEMLTDSGATAMQATPSAWRILVEEEWQGNKQLKALCGGEGLPRELATQLLDRCHSLWNLYGPTETTIWSTLQRVEEREGPVPIGRPIENTQVYLLDAQLHPVPAGVPAELYIGGAGLARGYFNRADFTAEKFIPNAFSTEGGARLFKTGDLARYLRQGKIEFLGRADQQVKLRGFRIELGEIEAVLDQHPAVRQCVAMTREDSAGDKRLVAYLVTHQGKPLNVNELRRFIKRTLPDYMIPSTFVTIEALPLTPNGKVDRRALPQPENLRPKLQAAYMPPRTEMERTIATVWQSVLNLEKVGRHDNFFDLGGHSLLAVQVHRRLREIFKKELSVLDIFVAPTVSALAKHLSQEQGTPSDTRQSHDSRGESRKISMMRQRQLRQMGRTMTPQEADHQQR